MTFVALIGVYEYCIWFICMYCKERCLFIERFKRWAEAGQFVSKGSCGTFKLSSCATFDVKKIIVNYIFDILCSFIIYMLSIYYPEYLGPEMLQISEFFFFFGFRNICTYIVRNLRNRTQM